MSGRYREFQPPAGLADHVACVWTFEGDDSDEDQRVAPDACCELIIHHGAPYGERGADGGLTPQPRALFAGQLTRPLHLRAEGWSQVTGVRFKPAGAWAFVGRPLDGLTDRRTPLADLHGDEAVLALLAACDRVIARSDRFNVILGYVARQIAAHPELRDRPVELAAALIQSSDGQAPVETLARRTGLSPRQLQRRFARAVGISPRGLAAVARFRRVFEALADADVDTWTDAAQAAGYFDHPQMARDFRRFVGCTPSAFVAAGGGLARSLAEPGVS